MEKWFFIIINFMLWHNMIIGQVNFESKKPVPSGLPFVQNYLPDEYGAFDQNWAIEQDSLDIMYFGNGDGVLTYDGQRWKLITLPNQGTVFSLASDSTGIIFVGGAQELGYLDTDSTGHLGFISLKSKLPERDQKFSQVRDVIATTEGIYFRSPETLMLWDGHSFSTWQAGKEKFRRIFRIHNTLLLSRQGTTILQVKDHKIVPLEGSEILRDKEIYTILPYKMDQLLIGTYDHGLFLSDGKKVRPFNHTLESYLIAHKIYRGTAINDTTFALGTMQGGIVFMDINGNLLFRINGDTGLPSSMIFDVYADKEHQIVWAATNYGIAKIEYPSAFSVLDENAGLKGTVRCITKYQGKIFAGTDRGLYALVRDTPDYSDHFLQINGSTDRVWEILSLPGQLLAAMDGGIYRLKNDHLTLLLKVNPHSIQKSNLDSNRIFVGHTDGVRSMYYQNEKWIDEGNIPGISGNFYDVIEADSGNLWLETNINKIFLVKFKNRSQALHLQSPEVHPYGMEHGLPDDVGQLHYIDHRLYYSSILYSNNTFRYEPQSDTFLFDPYPVRWMEPAQRNMRIDSTNVSIQSVDPQGNVWYEITRDGQLMGRYIAWRHGEGPYSRQILNEERIRNLSMNAIYFDRTNQTIWYGGRNGLFTHHLDQVVYQDSIFRTLIREVMFRGDSVLFTGEKNLKSDAPYKVLPFENNSFRFQYAATSFRDESRNQFQYYLKGFDQKWSDWTLESQAYYTNLPEGDYAFHVRAKNIFGRHGKEDVYHFSIMPPWYRTWWSYLIYVVLILSVFAFIIRWRLDQLNKEKTALEKVVDERTEEIRIKNIQLKNQTEKLREMDHQKSRFFANISHEFRTPLTLIKGPIDTIKEDPDKGLDREHIQMMDRNTTRLLRLVNQLLDLSRLDSKTLSIDPKYGDVFKFLKLMASSFESHALKRNISFQVDIPESPMIVLFDEEKLETVVYNLLGNAFKFSRKNDQISLSAEMRHNRLKLVVIDTGMGIKPEKIDHVFDRFYQIDDSLTRKQEGTGIGLTLTRELVELMHGRIEVESTFGEGSSFTLEIPMQTSEISDTVESIAPLFHTPGTAPGSANDDPVVEDRIRPGNKEDSMIALIVEDSTDMRNYITEQISDDYHILQAVNGREGWEMAIHEIPDIVITDLMMPELDGMELCTRLKTDKRTSHIPIIMLTAKAGNQQKIKGLKVGADSYLTKPFHRQELKVRVNNLVTIREQLQAKYSKSIYLEPGNVSISSMDEQFIENVKTVIERHFTDSQFGVPELQQKMSMSKTQLHRKLKALTDTPPGRLLRTYRLQKAAQILSQEGDTVTQVAYSVGFNNLSYFAKCFKEHYGVNPSEYPAL